MGEVEADIELLGVEQTTHIGIGASSSRKSPSPRNAFIALRWTISYACCRRALADQRQHHAFAEEEPAAD